MSSSTAFINSNYKSNDVISSTQYAKIVKLKNVEAIKKLIQGTETLHLFSDPHTFLTNLVAFPFNVGEIIKYQTHLRVGDSLTTATTTMDCECANIDRFTKYTFLMGQYRIQPHFHNYLDYNGYTDIEIYLPYYGWINVNTNEVMGKWLQFRLKINVLNGDSMWVVATSNKQLNYPDKLYAPVSAETGIDNVLGTYSCKIGVVLPLGSTNQGEIERNLLLGAIKTGGNVGMTIGLAAGGAFSADTTENIISTKQRGLIGRFTGSQVTDKTSTRQLHHDFGTARIAQAEQEMFNSAVQAINNMHVSANCDKLNDASLMGYISQSVQIKIKRPRVVARGSDFYKLYGKPSGKSTYIGGIKGRTILSSVEIENYSPNSSLGYLTEEEKDLLEAKLTQKKGIIL